jgi:peptide/nickel transport system permease protein
LSAQLLRLILQRIGLGVLTLLAISVLIFLSAEILPGDVAQTILGQSATPENLANLREQLGLNKPPLQRYLNWLGGVLHGDMGTALTNKQPVAKLIGSRFGNTVFLAVVSALIAVPISILLGLLAVRFRDSWIDKTISAATLTTISLPEFFVGYVLILFLAIKLQWFSNLSTLTPSMALAERLNAIILPCATLTLVVLAHMMRMTRAAIIGVMSSPYIEMAQLKGVSPLKIVFRHALPNALSPIINVVVVNLAYLIVGVVVVEVIFVYPGMGQLFVDNVAKRDLPVVQACGLIFATVFIGLNMFADILSIISNPKLRYPK